MSKRMSFRRMQKPRALTFVDACLNGEADLADIDDWVDRWHDTKFEEPVPSLDDYLGFTPDEGRLWVEKPASLAAIIVAHKSHIPVEKVLLNQVYGDLAADSSVSPEDTNDVLKWLVKHSRI
jgi:hypothetical protein